MALYTYFANSISLSRGEEAELIYSLAAITTTLTETSNGRV